MLGYLSHTRVLRFAGLFTWAMIVMPLVYTYWPPAEDGAHRSVAEAVMMSAFFIGFGASYFWLTRGLNSGGHAHWYDRLILLLLTICALAVSYLSGTGLGSILMMVAAGVIPWLLPLRVGVLWLVLSQLAVLPVFYYLRPDFTLFAALMQSLLYGGFSMFIFVTSLVARQQTDAREEQRRLNAELRATRALLAKAHASTSAPASRANCTTCSAITSPRSVSIWKWPAISPRGRRRNMCARRIRWPNCCSPMCARRSAICATAARSTWKRRCARWSPRCRRWISIWISPSR